LGGIGIQLLMNLAKNVLNFELCSWFFVLGSLFFSSKLNRTTRGSR